MRSSGVAVALLACMLPAIATAQWRLFESEFDDEKTRWKEIEAKLPAYPRTENLLTIDAGSATAHRFFIDAPSVSVGEDGVVRYSLVVKTAGGATNVSFEGIRCETRQQKYYAIGQPNGTWSRARDSAWRRIEYRDGNRHHGTLYSDVLCRGRVPVKDVKEAINAIKYGRPDAPRD